MDRLNLKADTNNEKLVLKHLESVASDSLVERINNGKKTLSDCWKYIVSEAKKKAVKGCACIDDQTVYGWAVHFFEEDSITAPKATPSARVETADKKPSVKENKPSAKERKPADIEQLSFDF